MMSYKFNFFSQEMNLPIHFHIEWMQKNLQVAPTVLQTGRRYAATNLQIYEPCRACPAQSGRRPVCSICMLSEARSPVELVPPKAGGDLFVAWYRDNLTATHSGVDFFGIFLSRGETRAIGRKCLRHCLIVDL